MNLTEPLAEPRSASLWRNPWFWLGVVLKAVCAFWLASDYLRSLFLPFIHSFIQSGFQNPWDAFAARGEIHSFPYSSVMLALMALPEALATFLLPDAWVSAEPIRLALARLPLFLADFAILWILCEWFEAKKDKVVQLYWLSPILFFITYIHGQLDAIPTALLFASLFFLFNQRFALAGCLFGLGLAAKFHLAMAGAYVLLYFWSKFPPPARWKHLASFLGTALVTAGVLVVPFLFSDGYRTMVLGTREMSRLGAFAISIGNEVKLYAAPFALMILLLRFAACKRVAQESLMLFLALSYGALVLLVPPMPGWYFWSIPFICYFFIRFENINEVSYWIVNGVYLLYYGLFWDSSLTPSETHSGLGSFFFTCLQGSLATVLFWIYRIGIRSTSDHSPENIPTLIGIAGDSGAGKDTFVHGLRTLLGLKNSLQTNGDDYHRWERGDKSLKEFTHLDPRANRLHLPVEHAIKLKSGQPIEKALYDHDEGKFTDPFVFKPKPYIFFVGLHSLYIRKMRQLLDLRIYLEPEEDLRVEWKVQRDSKERGYTPEQVLKQIEARRADAEKFIRPQRAYADWLVSMKRNQDGQLSVAHAVRNDLPLDDLVAALQEIDTLTVNWPLESDLEHQKLEVQGHLTAEQTQQVAERVVGDGFDIVGLRHVKWSAGYEGISQLLFLLFLRERHA
jgi:uridine kinase